LRHTHRIASGHSSHTLSRLGSSASLGFSAHALISKVLPVLGIAGGHPVISVFDEAWTFSARCAAMFHELIPTPSRRISCRLVVSHAGFDEGLLYSLYQRGLQLPEVGKDLRAGDGMLMHWSHTPMHHWQSDKWLLEMRRELPANDYVRKIENRFTSSSSDFISGEQWDQCTTLLAPPRCHPNMPVFIGLDGSTKRDSTAIVVVNGEGNAVRLVDHKIFVPSPGHPLTSKRSSKP